MKMSKDLPRRLRRLTRIRPDRDGVISFLLTVCIEDRVSVLANETRFQCLSSFLLDSPVRYNWWPRRFVLMPDHLHLIARQGLQGPVVGQWIKALKAILARAEIASATNADDQEQTSQVPPRRWRWQEGFHDHKFRTPESEARKWEYICLNPVRAGLVARPELWPYGGEFVYEPNGKSRLIRGVPPLLDRADLISPQEEDGTPLRKAETPGAGSQPTT